MKKQFDHNFYSTQLYWLREYVNSTFEEYYPNGLGIHLEIVSVIETFIEHLNMWSNTRPNELTAADKELAQRHVNRFFTELERLCFSIDDSRIAQCQKDLWILFVQLGEKMPWDFFPSDKQLLYFKRLFHQKAFRTQFISYYTGGLDHFKIDDSYAISVPRVCHQKLFAFLQAWNELEAGPEPLSDTALAQLLPSTASEEKVSVKKETNSSLPPTKSSADASYSERAAQSTPSYQKVPKPSFQPKLDEAWKSIQENTSRIQVLEDLDDEDRANLAYAQRTAQSAYTQPTQQAVKELKNLSQKFQQKSSSVWVALGLALLGLAMVIAGALTIAVSIGALSTGFFAPPAVPGTIGGIELIGTGLATLGAASALFGDSPEAQRVMK